MVEGEKKEHIQRPRSIILVGMPGAGKSTLGVMLAKALGKDFVDTDLLIQSQAGTTLQQIIDQQGYLHLRAVEESVLLGCQFGNHVVATGGSAVYSEPGMQHLRKFGAVVFLDVALDELRKRVTDYDNRGIARREGQSFESLFAERRALYLRYADLRIDCAGLSHNEALAKLLVALENYYQSPV
nr:shikimate kinase [Pseudomaricurvus alcaniphilus]